MSTPSGELIPDAIDALYAIAVALKTDGQLAAVDVDGVVVPAPEVLDGAEVGAITGCYLAIGVEGADDIAGGARIGQAGLAARTRQDSAAVTCVSWASGGNSGMRPYRAAAFAWYRALRDQVEADPRLGGAVTFAEVVSNAYRPKRSGAAAGAGLEFVVQATSL